MNVPDSIASRLTSAASIFGMTVLAVTARCGGLSWFFIFTILCLALLVEFLLEFRRQLPLNPYLFLWFSPLLLLHFSTIGDFRVRLLCFILLAYVFGFTHTGYGRRLRMRFLNGPIPVWLTAFFVLAAVSVALHIQGVQLSGDEPHYVMISQSIIEDGDFDLKNNIEEKTYFKYLPIDIRFHGGIHKDRHLSYHMPGVSFLILPFYTVFNQLEGLVPAPLYFRLVAAFLNAFFALCLFYVLRMTFPGRETRGIWLLFLVLYPLVFHGVHLYPELPAATLMMIALLLAFGKRKYYHWAGLALSCVLWFHVKYYPSVFFLGLIISIDIIKEKRYRELPRFLLFPLLNTLLLVYYSFSLYGAISPTSIFPKQGYLSTPLALQLKVFLAYFFDQRDGLISYSPLLLLLFFGPRHPLKNRTILLWIAVPYVILHAVTTVRGAYSPAGRPLLFVIWVFFLWTANYYFQRSESGPRYLFRLLTGFSFFVLFWLFYYPLFAYQPVFSQTSERASTLLLFMGSSQINLSRLFPSFLTSAPSTHPANFVWMGLLAISILIYYLAPRRHTLKKSHTVAISTALFLVMGYLLCIFPHVHIIADNRVTAGPISFYNNSRNFRYLDDRHGFNILAPGTYKLFVEPPKGRPHFVTLSFENTRNVDVHISNKQNILFRSQVDGNKIHLNLSELKTLKIRNKTVIPLELKATAKTGRTFLFMRIE